MKKTTFGALFTMAVSAFLGSAAMAQDYPFNPGDLMLDFRLANNTASKDLEVDLGTFNFSQSQAVVAGFSSADLTAAYGTFASQGSNLVFNLSATDGISYMIVSDPGNATVLTPTNPQASGHNTGQINALYNETSGVGGNGVSTGTPDNAFVITPSAADSASYTDVLLNVNKDYTTQPFANDFGFASYNMEQAYSASGSSITVYDQSATSKALGTFTLSGAGTLSYSVASAPEPSTYALLGLGALALFAMRRRFSQV